VAHAYIESRSLSEKAVVELLFILLGVVWGLSDRLTVFSFSVASPHSIDGFLASKEVV
jgi:hypothetical protein